MVFLPRMERGRQSRRRRVVVAATGLAIPMKLEPARVLLFQALSTARGYSCKSQFLFSNKIEANLFRCFANL